MIRAERQKLAYVYDEAAKAMKNIKQVGLNRITNPQEEVSAQEQFQELMEVFAKGKADRGKINEALRAYKLYRRNG